jgi:hypothetical protein
MLLKVSATAALQLIIHKTNPLGFGDYLFKSLPLAVFRRMLIKKK